MTAVATDPVALRREFRARRTSLSPTLRVAAAGQLAARLSASGAMPAQGFVAGYWALDGEIALHVWQTSLPHALRYCLPVLHDDGRLRFAPWSPGEPLLSNRFGIPEPDVAPDMLLDASRLALAIVPLVAFDANCHRVGMGGGWYDRTFAFRHAPGAGTPRLVGAAYEIQRAPRLVPAPWDVRLDAVCTEAATYSADTGST
ncbi:MAG: 5-formyltetrahydrofolate cyclo-ligase [Lysobacter sp.]|nr:MAG: 5-formyltetrahydrofolate cyclo-ligase [Lysobacter sp.]